MPSDPKLGPGLYERLVDAGLEESLSRQQDLNAVRGKLDDADAPEIYGQFFYRVIAEALRSSKPEDRAPLVNRLIALLADISGFEYLSANTLVEHPEKLLLALQNAHG